MGTHLKVLSESYPMNTNTTEFKGFSQKSLHHCALDESSLSIGRVKENRQVLSSLSLYLWLWLILSSLPCQSKHINQPCHTNTSNSTLSLRNCIWRMFSCAKKMISPFLSLRCSFRYPWHQAIYLDIHFENLYVNALSNATHVQYKIQFMVLSASVLVINNLRWNQFISAQCF